MRHLATILIVLTCICSIACGGGGSKTTATPTLSSIGISPVSASIATGQTKQLKVTGTYTDGTTQDLTGTVTWTSSNQRVATVNAAGLVSAVSIGSATITAASDSHSATASIAVTAPGSPALSSILITPASTTLAAGQTKQLKVTGAYSDGSTQDLSNAVTWSSSSQSIATVNASGVVTAKATGQATISAVSGSLSATASVNVTGAVLASIAVAPTSASVATGQTQQFSATGVFTDGSATDITDSVTWSSDTLGVATLSTKTPGLVSGVSPGMAKITATSGTVVGTAPLVVTAATLLSIDISPDDESTPIGGQVPYVVTGTYTDDSTQDLTNASFTSSDPAIAVIDPVTGIATGVATSPTPVTITATVGSLTSTTTLTVLSPTLKSISITPAAATLAVGTTSQLALTGVFSDGNTEPLTEGVTWTSSVPSIAGVDLNGLAIGIAAGQSTITAVYGGSSATATLTVVPPTPSYVSVTPATTAIGIGGTQQYTATAVFADGSTQDVTSQAQWESSSAVVALVSNTGLANALSMGSTKISAVFQNVIGSATLNVSSAKLTSITVLPAAPIVPTRTKIQFTAMGTFSDGNTILLTGVSWHSSSASLANMTSNGVARTKKTGTVTISASLNGVTGKTTMTITSLPLVSVTIAPDNPTIAPGTVQQFSLIGTFGDGSTVDLSRSAYWQTSNYQQAVISGSGLATAVAAGTVTITASFRGLSDTAILTVTNASIVSVSIAPASASITLGSSQQFTATGNFNDGSAQDISAIALWKSSDPAIAVVSKTGLATSAGRGTVNISATFKSKTATSTLTVN